MTSSDNHTFSAISQVHPSEAAELLRGGSCCLDVRTAEEFDAGHAPEALFLPIHELEARIGELDPSNSFLVICRSGGRSQAAAEFLVSKGFDASNISGGMFSWADAGLDIVTDDGSPGRVV